MYTIVIDTREQLSWDFSSHEECRGSLVETLQEGDYTTKEILDLERDTGAKILRIERKASSQEISLNLGKHKARFLREMERLSYYEHKFLILEFSLETLLMFPQGSGIPRKFWYRRNKSGKRVKNVKMSGNYMLKILRGIESEYGVHLIFAGDKHTAAFKAEKIIKEVHEQYFT